eukprot:COSAG01_NODE_1802_length_9198_cov_288.767447_3_plen_135_part_00
MQGKLLSPVFAGSFRCEREGVVDVLMRRPGTPTQLWMALQFQCTADGVAPRSMQGGVGVAAPSNVGGTVEHCDTRLACLPPPLPNAPVVNYAATQAPLQLTLVAGDAAAEGSVDVDHLHWTMHVAQTKRLGVSV